ncbi:MAG: ADP-glyceromanno-heptose 6-epimerase [Chitinophagaceae bacterium]|nr:ADP-glyceromanno-heptose 6-epimerase [Chitinophagaceae bacterium]
MIIVTGAAGFIASCLVSLLNKEGYENLILADEFSEEEKELNLHNKIFIARIERENLFEWLEIEKPKVEFVFHLGARTDTTEFDYAIHQHLNVEYSQKIWSYCTKNKIPLVYASSAATYGLGEFGYNDDHKIINSLQPLNPYGVSKNEFDKWALQQAESESAVQDALSNTPPFWAGLKFFNVYGPNEYHKARMASVIFHSYNQVKKSSEVKLFKSYKNDFKNGEQLRDFIYVKDVIKICYWFMQNQHTSNGIYNVGTGKARTFNDLVKATFAGLDLESKINYIDMPGDIKDKYQYYTEANMNKLKRAGYTDEFYSLEDGVDDYVKNYLSENKFY